MVLLFLSLLWLRHVGSLSSHRIKPEFTNEKLSQHLDWNSLNSYSSNSCSQTGVHYLNWDLFTSKWRYYNKWDSSCIIHFHITITKGEKRRKESRKEILLEKSVQVTHAPGVKLISPIQLKQSRMTQHSVVQCHQQYWEFPLYGITLPFIPQEINSILILMASFLKAYWNITNISSLVSGHRNKL